MDEEPKGEGLGAESDIRTWAGKVDGWLAVRVN